MRKKNRRTDFRPHLLTRDDRTAKDGQRRYKTERNRRIKNK